MAKFLVGNELGSYLLGESILVTESTPELPELVLLSLPELYQHGDPETHENAKQVRVK